MKIIQVCQRFPPDIGGIETHVFEISKRLAINHDVYVYTLSNSKAVQREETIENIKVRRFRSLSPKEGYFFSPSLYSALKKEECDILHLHSFHALPAYLGYLAFRKKNLKRMIFTPHYHPSASKKFRSLMHKIYDPFQAQIFNRADKIICVSDYEADLINKKFKVSRTKLERIPNGVDLSRLKKNISADAKETNEFRILCIARLEKYKRVQWSIRSLGRLLEKYPKKKITLTIVGKGPYEKPLRKITANLDLKEKVIFKKNISDDEIIKEYKNCDVFVMPSEYEAFSITTLEALFFGKPVVVSNIGFLKELSKNNGYTINSQEDLVEKLSKIIENGFKVNFDCNEYSWDKIVSQILKLYGE